MTATRRTWLWAGLALAAIVAVAAAGTYLMSPRPGGRMDPNATGPAGAHAVVALLRDRGVQVVVADTVADVAREARPDALVLVAETQRIADDELLDRLARLPGDLLLVAPDARARTALAPVIRSGPARAYTHAPDCRMRAAERAGSVDLRTTATYVAKRGQPVRSCYDGALVRYHSDERTVTVIGSASFMTNTDLAREGNAALALNLAGSRDRLIWYAPQRIEGGKSGTATISDLIGDNVRWLFWQLCVALALAALWKGRRLGPLVAERMPVVVRASETVEGLGRLYRSHRARDRAAAALRTATLRRLAPRLGLGPAPEPGGSARLDEGEPKLGPPHQPGGSAKLGPPHQPGGSAKLGPPHQHRALVAAVAQRIGRHPDSLWHTLFGPPPDSDDALVGLAHELDDIERQVTES